MDCDLVTQVCRTVFPQGSEITWNPGDVAPECRYWVIDGNREPRWIIPNDPEYGWPFLKHWTPYKPASRAAWKLLMAVYRTGLLAVFPHAKAIGVTAGTGEAWDHIGWANPNSPTPVIYVGSPGTARKAVAGLINPEGHCVGVAKFALTAEAGSAIIHEASILNRLETEKPGLAPCIQFQDEQSGISVQEAFEGEPTSRKLTESHVAWLTDMIVPRETTTLRETASSLAQRLKGIGSLDQETRNTLYTVLSRIDDPTPLPAVWVHGDFAPWNVKRTPDGALRAVDWESAMPKGLPLFDLIYYRSIQTLLFREANLFQKSVQPLLRHYMGKLGINFSMFPKITLACLAVDWSRCHDEGILQRASFLSRQLNERLRGTA